MKAQELFKELGYECRVDEDCIKYTRKNDYEHNTIFFWIGKGRNKFYDFVFMDWIDNKDDGWIPMSERPTEWLKHCAKYGKWQIQQPAIDNRLHRAINKQVEELGWDKEE